MKPLLTALLLLTAAAPSVRGDERARLTPREIADGWILLFDGETAIGWSVVGDTRWTIAGGMLAPEGGGLGTLISTTSFTDYDFAAEYRLRAERGGRLLIGCGPAPYVLGGEELWLPHNGTGWCKLDVKVRGSRVMEWSARDVFPETFEESGAALHPDSPRLCPGYLALVGHCVVFRDVKLRPLNTRPLLNGKDLYGWIETPGRGAKISVSDKRELLIQNGPGSLQTETHYSDFLMQLECRSLGADHASLALHGRELPVSGDWTAITLAVGSGHVAAWVNGRQKLDARLKNPGKKPITIQGTDVALRNVRVEELPGPEK